MSAVQVVDALLHEAIEQNASDIHLESTSSGLRIRLRVDGLLYDLRIMPEHLMLQILARIKILARLDVAERRVPQDGKFRVSFDGTSIDVRVATFPGMYGEKIVIRILERSCKVRNLDQLGLSEITHKRLLRAIQRSTGFFLVTGPTGSGKTTTLYGIVSFIESSEKNVVTLEDPVEYSIDGVTQGQILPEIGFTFERGMRALLRGDPDIIMVGEIRDKVTAEVAIQAALTGHLVLSTSHTHDAAGAVMRLLDMGVPAFLINATVSGVLAQRLVRVLCRNCKYEDSLNEQERDLIQFINVSVRRAFRAKGCELCSGRGYKGRTGIFELLLVTHELRDLITDGVSHARLVAQAIKDGMVPMQLDATEKIENGITSIAELVRVIW